MDRKCYGYFGTLVTNTPCNNKSLPWIDLCRFCLTEGHNLYNVQKQFCIKCKKNKIIFPKSDDDNNRLCHTCFFNQNEQQ